MRHRLTHTRSLLWFAALSLVATGCECGTPPIDGDAEIRLRDAGPPEDTGVQEFPDSGLNSDELVLAALVPDHGPFTGGNTVILRGSGFDADAQVTFGQNGVQPADHRLIDPRRLAVVVPAGEVGIVDVSVTVGDETVTLTDGYRYDSITVTPNSGSVAGGTVISLVGSGTNFQAGDTVTVGRGNCGSLEVVSATRMTCRTPAAVVGTVDVTVTRGEDSSEVTVEDAFTYFDSSDPFTGGLGGGPIEGSINVTVIDAFTGAPVPDAYAILGEDLETEHQGLTDALGQITFSGEDVAPPATVHVGKHCYEKTSFHSFDARDMTIFLQPWQDPMCASDGDPPPGGGRGVNGATIEGELVFLGPNEMGPNPWLNVPEARPGWVRVAYVYATQSAIGVANWDPTANGATQRVLESPTGRLGYPYSIFVRPRGMAVYAIAGLESTNALDRRFIPYVMGIARNVLAGPSQRVQGVDVVMDIPLDHNLDVELTDLPDAVIDGPDAFRITADIDLGGEGVIVRNVRNVALDVLRGRSASRSFQFVAQPALQGALSDGRYRVEAGWYTTAFDAPPYTVAVETGITSVDETVVIGDFLGIVVPTAPAYGERLPADRILRWQSDGPDPDFYYVIVISNTTGNPEWSMFVPGNVHEAPMPNLAEIEGISDIAGGFLTWAVFSVQVPGFVFDEFRYNYLAQALWDRYSLDVFAAQR